MHPQIFETILELLSLLVELILHPTNLPTATSSASRQKKSKVWRAALQLCSCAARVQFAQFTQGKVHNLSEVNPSNINLFRFSFQDIFLSSTAFKACNIHKM